MKHWLWTQISTNGSFDLAKLQAVVGIPCLIILLSTMKWLHKALMERRKRKWDKQFVEDYSKVMRFD